MTTVRKIVSIKPIYNFTIDKDIQSMLLPLNLTQYMMFCHKYRIKNNLITPNGLRTKCITIIGTIIFIFSIAYRTFSLSFNQNSAAFSPLIYYYSYYDTIYYGFGLILSCVLSIRNTKKHVRFILIFQKVHRFLNDKTVFKQSVVFNWLFVITCLVIHFTTVISVALMLIYYIKYVWNGFVLVVFDLNVVHTVRFIKLLEDKVEVWRTRLLNSPDLEITDLPSYSKGMFQAFFFFF
ncbi:hypothetical protein B5X24_HaOG200733 [Helicoverpa armigera]|uniref:Gustatory receptor n=1 Tax=Helicoverpa armigera TaxID=29058 RepID=A0A2W1BZ66_HELAM|nr:hypothetical protein B5X24_HaOG200733 [Helicoverpa armigera]